MKLRTLELRDAEPMLEWMHDASVVSELKGDFLNKKLSDCIRFIENAKNEPDNIHFAISDNGGMYMGTVSLKHVHSDWAEFAIVVGKKAMGVGIAQEAMKEILSYGIEQMKLSIIYWCVSKDNHRAIRFYDKNGYVRTNNIPKELECLYENDNDNMFWYSYVR